MKNWIWAREARDGGEPRTQSGIRRKQWRKRERLGVPGEGVGDLRRSRRRTEIGEDWG